MIVHEWKSCEFFDLVLLSSCCKVDVQSEIVAHCANGNIYILCEILGFIHVYFRNFWTISFRYQCSGLRFCALTTNNEFLVLVAEEQSSKKIRVEVLNLAKLNTRDGAPCVASAVLNQFGRVTTIRTCLIKEHLCISIGLDNGNLLIHRSVMSLDMSSNFFCISTGKCSIIGTEFQYRKNSLYLFVCSEERVGLYNILDNNISAEENLEYFSTITSSSILHNSENSFFLVGREDALYCFTIDGRGPCYAIGGKKKHITCLNKNIVILIESEESTRSHVIVIDTYNKAIVFQKEIPHTNKDILVSNEISCYILMRNAIYITKERSLLNKMLTLMNNNFFDLALNLCKKKKTFVGCILLSFGDYLLSKGDLISATSKYKETIGIIEPYFIIKRLLNAEYSCHLSYYINYLVNVNNTSSTQMELMKSCNIRNNLCFNYSTNVVSYESEFSENCFNGTTICTLSESYENELYYAITNQPLIISKHWKNIFALLKVSKNPIRYISPLINTQANCIEYLEYLLSVHNKSIVFDVLLELHLLEWYRERKNIAPILNFLRKNSGAYSEQILIHFVNYSFWPGVVYLCENFKMLQMYFRYCIKYNDLDNANVKKISIMNKNISLQTIDIMKCSSQIAKVHLDRIITNMLNENKQNILALVQGISVAKIFNVIHLKQLFCKSQSDYKTKSCIGVKVMVNSLRTFIASLSRFRLCPIEFRNSVCDICKCKLSLPSIYFLCQHACHLECVDHSSSDKFCPKCLDPKKSINESKLQIIEQIKWTMPYTMTTVSFLFSKKCLNTSS